MTFPPDFDSTGNANLVYPEILNLDKIDILYPA